MYRLRLFGGATLEGPTGPVTDRASQRRPLALLALLAVAGESGLSRARIVGYLWPERQEKRARHLLSVTLHAVRKSLGSEAVLSIADELRLNPELVSVDVWDFEAALSADDLEEAIALYEGPLLDGFQIREARGFERWLDRHRERYARALRGALEDRAEHAEELERWSSAADWWRRLAAHDPYSSRVTLRLMQALERAGDRPAAIREARAHAIRMEEELELAPDPEVEGLAGRLHEALRPVTPGPDSGSSPGSGPGPGGTPPATVDPPGSAGRPPPGDGAVSESVEGPVTSTRTFSDRALTVAVALTLGGGLVGALVLDAGGRDEPETTVADRLTVVVLPFDVRGDASAEYLREGFPVLLSAAIDGVGPIQTVDPAVLLALEGADGEDREPVDAGRLARSLGADVHVAGSVVPSGQRLAVTLTARAGSGRGVETAHATAEGRKDDVPALVDQLALELVQAWISEPPARLTKVAVRTTGSMPALKAFLEGLDMYRRPIGPHMREAYAEAADAFARAAEYDSTFALAHYYRAHTLTPEDPWLAAEEIRRATRHAASLHWRERALIEALDLRLQGRFQEAEQLYTEIIDKYPLTAEALFQLGEMLFNGGPLYGRSVFDARGPLERGLELDPERSAYVRYLAVLSGLEGDAEKAVEQLQAAFGSDWLPGRVGRAIATGEELGADLMTELRTASPRHVSSSATTALILGDLGLAERIAELMASDGRPTAVQLAGYWLLARIRAAMGKWSSARATLEAAASLGPVWSLQERAALAELPFVPASRAHLESLRTRLHELGPNVAGGLRPWTVPEGAPALLTAYHEGALSVRLGDTTTALQRAAELERWQVDDEISDLARDLALSLRARVAFHEGNVEEGSELLDQASRTKRIHLTMITAYLQRNDRFLRAEQLRTAGRFEEAERWYRSLHAPGRTPFRVPVRVRLAEIADRLGHFDRALDHCEEALRLWRRADREMRVMLLDSPC